MEIKTTEEKIDEIHDTVLILKENFTSFKDLCALKHVALDSKVKGLDKELNGNGVPGLVDKHLSLEKRFDKFETKIITWCCAAILIAQVFAPKLAKALGWS